MITKDEAYIIFSDILKAEHKAEAYNEKREIVDEILRNIERAVDRRNEILISEIKGLKRLDNKTYFVGPEAKFSKGCKSCLCGSGLTAIRKTNKCNLNCKFCYYYGHMDSQREVPEGMWEIGGTYFYENDLDLLISICKKPTGIAYAYLEPFIEIEKYFDVIRKFREAGIHQHLYTNGSLAKAEDFKKLGDAGLDEIRFNLGATKCSDDVISKIEAAKKYIPMVGIETPMTKEFWDVFNEKKEKILSTGLDFINCAELHLNPNNMCNYLNENNYICRRGYISPIDSREITFKMMKMADEENWGIVVHDCSNMTKFARELHFSNSLNMWYGATSYSCEFEEIPFELFLPILKDDAIGW